MLRDIIGQHYTKIRFRQLKPERTVQGLTTQHSLACSMDVGEGTQLASPNPKLIPALRRIACGYFLDSINDHAPKRFVLDFALQYKIYYHDSSELAT
jgi:hypothetical protein